MTIISGRWVWDSEGFYFLAKVIIDGKFRRVRANSMRSIDIRFGEVV